MKTKLTVLLLLLSLVSCGGNSTQNITVKNRYRLTLPDWMTKTTGLNNDASLQYQNSAKNFYAIVIDEPKANLTKVLTDNNLGDLYTNNLKGYAKFIIDGMDPSIKVNALPDFTDSTINGLPARELSFEGVSSGYRVYWKQAFIEGNNHYYQVMVWTLAENQKKYEKQMVAIIKSFTETDKSKK